MRTVRSVEISTELTTGIGLATAPVTVQVAERGRGRPVLLLHGGAGSGSVEAFADVLADDHTRVLVPTHPGFNGTPRPEGLTTIRRLAAVYVGLLQRLDLTDVTVVGNSIGGWIAAEMALLTPPRVASYVLVDAVGIEVPDHPVVDFFALTFPEIARRSYHDPDRFAVDPTRLPPPAQAAMAANRETLRIYGGRPSMVDPGLRARLAAVTAPVLIVWGDSDRIADPDYGRALADAIPTARFELLPDTGHLPQIESPHLLLPLVRNAAHTPVQVTVEVRRAALRVEDHHNAATGDTALLFLHYWGGSAATWRKVIARLDDVRCVAVNQRGWGGSTVNDGRYDLDSMAEDVLAIIERLDLERVVLVGHSMGGKVAQVVARAKPPEVRGLVLVAPAPPTPMPVPEEVREGMFRSYLSADGVAGPALDNLAGPNLPAEDRAGIVADTLAGDLGAKHEWTERIMIADLGLAPGDIEVPVTLVVGSLDRVENPDRLHEVFGETVPQTCFVDVPGVGHLSPLEAPDAVAAACRDMLATVAGV